MRTVTLDETIRDESDELLTTGEAASLLGVSRQHVVNLTNRGDLPYETSGSHRRVRRSDVALLRHTTTRMSADQRRSLRLAYAVAGAISLDPQSSLALAQENLSTMRARHPRGQAARWLDQWQELLEGPLDELLFALTSPSQRSRELRQNNPFAGVLTAVQREAILASTR